MGWTGKALLLAAAGAAAFGAAAMAQPTRKAPIATYWMSAQTLTGMGAMAGPGGRPSAGAMMGMMMGGGMGGGGPQHQLTLQLGSQRQAQGEPSAEHLPPPSLKAGQSLPLVTPRSAPPVREEPTEVPRDFQRPKGRMLIFWGCGEHAKPGQPVVIDFATIGKGQVPPGLAALSKGLSLTPMQPPAPGRSTTYGEWPNERTRTNVPGNGSLIGEHVVRGNYSPEIRFSLEPNQDFLGPLTLTANRKNPSGSGQLAWRPVPGSLAYMATAMGGGQNDTVVMWSSSEVQASAFALPDYIAPGDISRLVASHALMSPQTTSCTIPKEVIDAAPSAFVQMAAYGGEANFVYPPRPADPKAAWNPEWQVKVRYRSATSGILGMDMNEMGGGMGDDEDRPGPRGPRGGPPPRGQAQPPQSPAGAIMRGLGGLGRLPGF